MLDPRTVVPYLVLIAACSNAAEDPELVFPEDGDGKGDYASAMRARLLDPARASLPFECSGAELPAEQLVDMFDPSFDTLKVRGTPYGDVSATPPHEVYVRKCNPTTGCSAFKLDAASSGRLNDFRFDVRVDAAGTLKLLAYGEERDRYATTPVAIPSIADVIYQGIQQYNLVRARFTLQSDGNVCVSAVTPVYVTYDGRTSYFAIGKALVRWPKPAGDAAAPAPFAAFQTCEDPPLASAQAVVDRYFAAGDDWVALGTAAGTRVDVKSRRYCHPITGCTPWGLSTENSLRLEGIRADASGLAVKWSFDTESGFIPLVGGTFHGTAPYSWLVDEVLELSGHLGSACAQLDIKFLPHDGAGPTTVHYRERVTAP